MQNYWVHIWVTLHIIRPVLMLNMFRIHWMILYREWNKSGTSIVIRLPNTLRLCRMNPLRPHVVVQQQQKFML